MAELSALLNGFCRQVPVREVTGITSDSRRVVPGDLFCAIPGDEHDGRQYVSAAISAGAAAVVYDPAGNTEPLLRQSKHSVPMIPLPDLRSALGDIAARFYDHPSAALTVIGITGTNGKTSCVHLLAQALEHLGCRCGVIGTLGTGFIDALESGLHTTPDPVMLQQCFHTLQQQGATHVAMEVSSHALDQGRVNGVAFDLAVFTNLSRDHLDYHRDLAEYGAAKARLFAVPSLKAAVLNGDDPYTSELLTTSSAPQQWLFGVKPGDVVISDTRTTADGLQVDLQTPRGPLSLATALLGRVNADNLAAVASTLLLLGHPPAAVASAVNAVRPVPGRMELFAGGPRLPQVVVDYAHTPDALERALRSLRDHCNGELWCLFGCGGDRDRGKRPTMGAIARRWADHVVLTNDNPRSEDPRAIAVDIVGGMPVRPIVIHDRVRAIDWSIHLALPQDWVLIAGKGHETTQQFHDRATPHDDRHVVRDLLGVAA